MARKAVKMPNVIVTKFVTKVRITVRLAVRKAAK